MEQHLTRLNYLKISYNVVNVTILNSACNKTFKYQQQLNIRMQKDVCYIYALQNLLVVL